MYEYEKAQEALRYQNSANKPYDTCGQIQAQSSTLMGSGVRVPLREQLEKSAYDRERTHDRANRALAILTQHPEFELFLELQELINSGLYR